MEYEKNSENNFLTENNAGLDILLNNRDFSDEQINLIRQYKPLFYSAMSELSRLEGFREEEIFENFELCELLCLEEMNLYELKKKLENRGMIKLDVLHML